MSQITFEGETREAYDPSYIAFTDSFRTILGAIFGPACVIIDDEWHGGGVEFGASYIINHRFSPSQFGEIVAALITLTEGNDFANLIIYEDSKVFVNDEGIVPRCDFCWSPQMIDSQDWNGDTGCHYSCEKANDSGPSHDEYVPGEYPFHWENDIPVACTEECDHE